MELDQIGRAMRQRDAAAAWFLRNRPQMGVAPDSLEEHSGIFFTLARYQRIRPAYVGLLESGRLALLKDDELRNSAVRYFEHRQESLVQQLSDWSMVREQMLSRIYRHARVSAPSDITEVLAADGRDARFEVNLAWPGVRADDELMILIARLGATSGSLARGTEDVGIAGDSLAASLDAWLGS